MRQAVGPAQEASQQCPNCDGQADFSTVQVGFAAGTGSGWSEAVLHSLGNLQVKFNIGIGSLLQSINDDRVSGPSRSEMQWTSG